MTDEMAAGDHFEWDDDEDIPEADPAIRTSYEAALGRLILAHNNVDLHLTRLIECCLRKLGDPPELARLKNGMFAQRLENLRMLNAISSALHLRRVKFDELTDLNTQRNIVAHGHFEQNPYDGDYILITNKKKYGDYSIYRLNRITDGLIQQVYGLGPLVDFYDFIIEQAEGAEPAAQMLAADGSPQQTPSRTAKGREP
jgi:hypothetical protein